MISLSDRAGEALREALERRHDPRVFRLSPKDHNYDLHLDEVHPGDQVISYSGRPVLAVDQRVAAAYHGTLIDADEQRHRLTVRPAALVATN